MLLLRCESDISSPDFWLFSNLFFQPQEPGNNPGWGRPFLHVSPRCLHVPVRAGRFFLIAKAQKASEGISTTHPGLGPVFDAEMGGAGEGWPSCPQGDSSAARDRGRQLVELCDADRRSPLSSPPSPRSPHQAALAAEAAMTVATGYGSPPPLARPGPARGPALTAPGRPHGR